MYKLVAIDLDGTLLDTYRTSIRKKYKGNSKGNSKRN